MTLHGLQKMTLLDYPGRVACTLFTFGCNLRCPFCHNAGLVTAPDPSAAIPEEEVLRFLSTRQGLLDGVCVTGGEPLLQPDIADFLAKVKALGFLVKLDTNGCYPQALRRVVEAGLVDYVAMDIKNSPAQYPVTVGLPTFDLAPVEESVRYLLEGHVDYEFRTTVVKELHTTDTVREAARWIAGAPRYYLQAFVDSGNLIGQGLTAPDPEQLRQMVAAAREFVKETALRGV
ncbi:MAG: anaerobic ribonucleoside-triphosphate reductase activating protein [Ruminococcaceae bacterium]|nr:anaerobic ribonucleoside-triphosphate reductase activating protein [Oscillospiraceae bacterium]